MTLRSRFSLLAIAIFIYFSVSSTPTSAHFFPNVSSLPTQLLNQTNIAAWEDFMNFAGCHAGSKYNGLSKLKQYFQHFGYIPKSPFNFTDDFDDVLESAIKTYQKNFNLNVTGELDVQTLQQVVRPRCGVADIINGLTTMNTGKINVSAFANSTKFHSVAHYSFFPGQPRWSRSKQNLSYAFFSGNDLTDTVKTVFKSAFQRWSEVTTLTFTEAPLFESADIKIGFFTGDHGDGEPFDGKLGTLGHAFSPQSGMFHLDGAEDWVVSGDVTKSPLLTAVDLESVAVHEIGHLLGLGHSSLEDAIMYPSISSRTRKVELTQDDIQGVQALYGTNPNFNGSSTLSQGKEVSGGGGGHHRGRSRWWGLTITLAIGIAFLAL